MSFDSKTESVENILLVAQRTAFNKRDFNLVKLLSVVTKRRHKSLLLYTQLTTLQEKMTSEEAFAYPLENKLSKSVYENTHKEAPCRFPSYRAIVEIKNEYSPIKTSIKVTETKAKVQLQDLMDHKSKRLVKLQEKEILKYLNDRKKDSDELILISSWGMDGSSSLSKYHQSFNNSNRNNLQDSDLLVTATSPLRLYVHSDPNNIIWNNMKMKQYYME